MNTAIRNAFIKLAQSNRNAAEGVIGKVLQTSAGTRSNWQGRPDATKTGYKH